ncbi:MULTISPECIES: hypothetical protein [unclassified Breznakia]|uniref:hypothetical protein n=1 Tax=unclassified Breznakia TaxID=2623764 RepID=UPI002405FE63|nr:MULTISPECIES: hypothetical protein [unclassified Breznakia]
MSNYTNSDFSEALLEVLSIINKCEKMHGKFEVGSSQYTLLTNRIKAMYIAKMLLTHKLDDDLNLGKDINEYSKKELSASLEPISSILRKCEKAQRKYEEGTTNYNRFVKQIKTMYIVKMLVEEALEK